VNTIHDLSFFQTQALFPATKRLYKRVVCSVALRRSRGIIAVSNFTRNEILRRFPIDQGKVVVIHNGFCAPPCGQRQGGSPYVLFVGTLEKRKDVATLVRAFGLLRRSRRIPHRLILVGQRGFGWGEIQAAIRSTSCPQDIDCLGHTKREEVERLFRGADLFVYPSTYEGFGLPILEAMACGTPVACSRAASLPEVAGDAAEYFEPASVDGLAEAMERVLGSAARQDELRRKGLERVKLFSWDECARRHLAVYRELAGNGKSRATSTGQAGTFAKD
jgi:glycosyltransferase involved in cell wall biosynthesis